VNKIVKKTLPVLLTSAAVIVALLVLRQLWVYYMDEPWTRDAAMTMSAPTWCRWRRTYPGWWKRCRWPTTRR